MPRQNLTQDRTPKMYTDKRGYHTVCWWVFKAGKWKRGRGVRLVPVSECLKGWLENTPFPIHYSEKGFDSVRAKAGLADTWQPDILRHTYISTMLAIGNSEDSVAQWAGNSPRIIHTYYKGLITPKEANQICSISRLQCG